MKNDAHAELMLRFKAEAKTAGLLCRWDHGGFLVLCHPKWAAYYDELDKKRELAGQPPLVPKEPESGGS